MSLPRYPRYKDSDVEWLGEVPEHWSIRKVRWLCEITKRIAGTLGLDVLSITQQGVKVKDTESNEGQISMDYSKYQHVEVGDFAMNHMDLLTGYVDISPVRGVTSPDYRVFKIREGANCHDRYLLYLFQMGYRQKIFYAYGQGSSQLGRWRLPTEQFNELPFPLPPLPEQVSITAFLDCETAKIDALMAEQERLIELLKEKRQAVISHAVTRGLSPNVPMKASGIEWLGEVPAHWEVKRLKALSSTISKGTTPTTIGADFTNHGVRFLKAENITESGVSESPAFYIADEAHAMLSRSALESGDVLVVIAGATTGRSAVLGSALAPANTNQAVSFIRPLDAAHSEYISRWLGSRMVRDLIALISVQSAQPNLSMEDLGNIPIPVPPSAELRSLMARLSNALVQLDALTAEAQRAIDLLQERRMALISAAVTGQIDVRSSARPTAARL